MNLRTKSRKKRLNAGNLYDIGPFYRYSTPPRHGDISNSILTFVRDLSLRLIIKSSRQSKQTDRVNRTCIASSRRSYCSGGAVRAASVASANCSHCSKRHRSLSSCFQLRSEHKGHVTLPLSLEYKIIFFILKYQIHI